MNLTKDRIRVLCRMAKHGAIDDAGREFADATLEEFENTWVEMEKQITAQSQARVQADQAAKEGSLRESIKQELSEELAKKVADKMAEQSPPTVVAPEIVASIPAKAEKVAPSNGAVKP